MAKRQVVIFTPDTAIILKGPMADDYASHPGALINPDRTAVLKTPPHAWKMTSRRKLVPMGMLERKLHEIHIRKHGIDRTLPPKPRRKSLLGWVIPIVGLVVAGLFLYYRSHG